MPFTGFGALAIWVFFLPNQTLRFDSTDRQATLIRTYPFGVIRRNTWPLDDIAPAQVGWERDSERIDGGYWTLNVDLPGGRPFQHIPEVVGAPSDVKAEAERLRDAIADLLRA